MDTRDIIRAAGGPSRIARLLGKRHSTVSEWRRVPAEYVAQIAEASGLHPHLIRPDVFGRPVGTADDGSVAAPASNHNPVVAEAQQ